VANKKKTQIIVRELKEISTGQTNAGASYTLYQVRATKPDGTEIPGNLRTFDSGLPIDEVIDVEVEKFTSEQYGESFTISMKKPNQGERIEKLESRVKEQGQEIETLKAQVEDLKTKLAPPPVHPVAPPENGDGQPGDLTRSMTGAAQDDDIPF
jgi:hypothetical protein